MTSLVLLSIVVSLAGNKIFRKKIKLKFDYLQQKKLNYKFSVQITSIYYIFKCNQTQNMSKCQNDIAGASSV